MKTPRYYISLAFAKYDPLKLAGFAENIAAKMALITFFAAPEPPLADITAAATNLRQAEEATDQGGTIATEERDNAFDALEGLLRELGAYIEDKAKNNKALMLSTGFEVTTASHSALRSSAFEQGCVDDLSIPDECFSAKCFRGRRWAGSPDVVCCRGNAW